MHMTRKSVHSWRLVGVLGVLMLGGGNVASLFGEEPYERFLEKLRDERLFDLAIVYLDQLDSRPGLKPEMKSGIELERGLLLYQSAAILPGNHAERKQKLDDAERSLSEFLETRRRHPRRGEARLKLGELLLTRAEEAKKEADDPTVENQSAVQYYTAAHELFESTIKELAEILEPLKGARTDPNDKAKVAYRQQVQQDIRQAQLLSAKAIEDRGLSRVKGSRARLQDLQRALQMFSDLYAKEQRMVGVRNYALFYRSSIQSTLGKSSDAIDGFQRIVDLEGVDVLRPLQTNSVTELVRLLGAAGKYPLAVDRGDQWLGDLRPDEEATAEAMNLNLQLATTKIEWAETLKKKDPDDRVASRLIRNVRADLQRLMRLPGPHLDRARELLSQLGVSTDRDDSTEMPEVESFAEALSEAQQRIDDSESDLLGLQLLREQGKSDEAQSAEEAIDLAQRQAIDLLSEGLRLFSSDDERQQLTEARFRLAYLLLKQQRPWEAMTVAEYLSKSHPGSDTGLRAAAITLGALSDLLKTAGPDAKISLTAHLEPFAEYLVKTWPQSAESAAAASALVQLALVNRQMDRVDQFLGLVPAGSKAATKLQQDVGIALYSNYLLEREAEGDDADSVQSLKARANKSLEQATSGLSLEDLDANSVNAVNARVRLLLTDQRADVAAELLIDGAAAPIRLLQSKPQSLPPKVAMECYRSAIQVVISLLAQEQLDSREAIDRTRDYVGRLQSIAGQDPAGETALSDIFVGLAQDTSERLSSTQQPALRRRLSQALAIVAAEAGKSDSFRTQLWAADTIIGLAEELSRQTGTEQIANNAFADGAEILDRILTREQSESGWIDPPKLVTKVRMLLANSLRGEGEFKEALNQLTNILSENSGLLDVQIEAAKTYQAWGEAVNYGFHKAAIMGGRPNARGQNLIWGFGSISQRAANNPKFEAQFFQARYELARSRYLYARGLSTKDKELGAAEMLKAEKDITSTASLYPELGGASMRKNFDSLLRVIQKALGKPPQGLAAVQ